MKNKRTKLAAGLLCVTMMTSCFVGGTLARYTTAAEGSDQARVAYWGFNAENSTLSIDLFDGTYNNGTVDSSDDSDVLAPGTKDNTTFGFAYKDGNGGAIKAPEVAYNFAMTLTENGEASNYAALDANKNFTWSVDMPGTENDKTGIQTVAALKEAIAAANGDYAAGKLPTGFAAGTNDITIGWEWAAHTDADGDKADTAMGNADSLDNVNFTISVSATQK